MKQYDYILLDWDGNIAQTLNLWVDVRNKVLQKRNIQLTRPQLIDSCRGFVDYVTKTADITKTEATKALEESKQLFNDKFLSIELYPGTAEALAELRAKGKHLALITTSERWLVTPVLERFNLTELFEVVITDNDVEKTHRKPHPKPLCMALEKMGGTPHKAIMVGDRDKDILAGHNAEMDSVLFYPEMHRHIYCLDELIKHRPTYIMNEFKYIADIVSGVHAPLLITV